MQTQQRETESHLNEMKFIVGVILLFYDASIQMDTIYLLLLLLCPIAIANEACFHTFHESVRKINYLLKLYFVKHVIDLN
jgi:hypothetical protein